MNSYDILKFLTINLTSNSLVDTKNNILSATGFYATINGITVIVTAKHFARNTDSKVTLTAHYKDGDTIISLPVTAYANWIASYEYDIAFCAVTPFEDKVKEITGHDMFYTAISEKNIMTKKELREINILSEVLTMGYPAGLSSTHHSFPLFKKGYISSIPRDFEEDGEGYLDLCVNNGMSGAPVILNDSPLKLLGVLIQNISDRKNPTSGTTIYVAADKVLEMLKSV